MTWKAIQDHIWEKLQLSTFNLKMGLHRDPQGNKSAQEFTCKFEQKATDAGVKYKDAKSTLITLLNEPTI